MYFLPRSTPLSPRLHFSFGGRKEKTKKGCSLLFLFLQWWMWIYEEQGSFFWTSMRTVRSLSLSLIWMPHSFWLLNKIWHRNWCFLSRKRCNGGYVLLRRWHWFFKMSLGRRERNWGGGGGRGGWKQNRYPPLQNQLRPFMCKSASVNGCRLFSLNQRPNELYWLVGSQLLTAETAVSYTLLPQLGQDY